MTALRDSSGPPGRVRNRTRLVVGAVIAVLIAVLIVFFIRRLVLDASKIAHGSTAAGPQDRAYLEVPWVAYLHVVPGVLFILGGALQLSARFRQRHYAVHRRLGRVVLACGVISGVFAIAFGIPHSFGGAVESITTVIFGVWFLICLGTAYLAIRRSEVVTHRQWMIRAYAVGLAPATIRIVVGIGYGGGLTTLADSFAIGFPLAFVVHALVAEVWLARTPRLAG